MMQRRLFLQALAASVVAVGAPLPVGFPTNCPRCRGEMFVVRNGNIGICGCADLSDGFTAHDLYNYLAKLPDLSPIPA